MRYRTWLSITLSLAALLWTFVLAPFAARPAEASETLRVPYSNGISGCLGSAGSVGANRVPPSTPGNLKVMAFNVAEPRSVDHVQRIADLLSEVQPDIVLLNEVKCRFWDSPWNAAQLLAQRAGYAYFAYEDATWNGVAGTKGVAILSKYPITDTRFHVVRLDGRATAFGTLDASISIGNVAHRVLSTRYSPMHKVGDPWYHPEEAPENRAGHLQALDLAWGIPTGIPVIFGGDFNASWIPVPDNFGQHVWSQQFRDANGMKDAAGNIPDPVPDYIYYRGMYTVVAAQHHPVSPDVSDHPFVLAELATTTVLVPNVVGATASEATGALRRAGLAVRQTLREDPYCMNIGMVLTQSPKGGTRVHRGSTVTISVATQPSNPCP